jgi:hypothetical protein
MDAIITYVNLPPPAPKVAPNPQGDPNAQSSDNTLLYAILTIILLVVVIVLTSVNKVLSRSANAREVYLLQKMFLSLEIK